MGAPLAVGRYFAGGSRTAASSARRPSVRNRSRGDTSAGYGMADKIRAGGVMDGQAFGELTHLLRDGALQSMCGAYTATRLSAGISREHICPACLEHLWVCWSETRLEPAAEYWRTRGGRHRLGRCQ